MRVQHSRSHSRRREERGQVLVFLLIGLVVVIAALGLTIDVARAYLVRSELSKALDAALLAESIAREDGTAEAIVRQRFRINFRPGFLGLDPGEIVIGPMTVTTGRDKNGFVVRSVAARAAARLPTTFLRVLGLRELPVGSSARVHRRLLDILLVIDKSGSIGGDGLQALKQAAKAFLRIFNPSWDRVGIVSFGGHFEWGARLDTVPGFRRGAVEAAIDAMELSGWTAGGPALGEALQELDARWIDGRWRVILYFTDGAPNAVRARFPFRACRDAAGRTYPPSGGVIEANGAVLAAGEEDSPSAATLLDGLFQPEGPSGAQAYYEAYGFDARSLVNVTDSFEPWQCYDVRNRIERLPTVDYYGASLYAVPSISGREVRSDPGGDGNRFRRYLNGMARNELENLAAIARRNRGPDQGITIMAVGLDGAERNLTRRNEEWDETGREILERLANVPEAGRYYHPEEPRGLFILADLPKDLERAFEIVGTSILRLTE